MSKKKTDKHDGPKHEKKAKGAIKRSEGAGEKKGKKADKGKRRKDAAKGKGKEDKGAKSAGRSKHAKNGKLVSAHARSSAFSLSLHICPCCSKRCPLSKPKCGKGRAIARKKLAQAHAAA